MSKKIGLFYGSTTGKTEAVAQMIQEELGGDDVVTLHDMSQAEAADFDEYECLIIGCPTWDIGELQSDWDGFYQDELENIDFSGKTVAYFGTGDQIGYSDNFQDAMGILETAISEKGGKTVGYTSTDGYDFDNSQGVKNGKFVGLAIDEDNQSDLTDKRVKDWTAQLKTEFGL